MIYGKKVGDKNYRCCDASEVTILGKPVFPGNRIFATLVSTFLESERICYLLENEHEGYVFEGREV